MSTPHRGQYDHDHLLHGVLVQVLGHPVQHEEVGGAEVGEHADIVLINQDVHRLDVAMTDSAYMKVIEALD